MQIMRRLLQQCPPHKQLRMRGIGRLSKIKKYGGDSTHRGKCNLTLLEIQYEHQRCNWSVYAHLQGESGYENSKNFVDNHDRTQLHRKFFVVPGYFSQVAVFIRLSREHLYKKESEPIFFIIYAFFAIQYLCGGLFLVLFSLTFIVIIIVLIVVLFLERSLRLRLCLSC